jgi:succinate dehydrogenase / fumarate reductase cytochrome b subunit
VVAGFSKWPITVAYTVALLALALHIRHGIGSALTTIGLTTRYGALISTGTAVLLTGGFLCVPYAVLGGALR